MYQYFLSDIHIGMNVPENWYQPSVHEKPLKKALEYITAKGKEVSDVVILGDWFDNWAYTEAYPMKQATEILDGCIEHNLALFTAGDNANFVDLMGAIGGHLQYVNGNHDMVFTVDMINEKLQKVAPNLKQKIYGNSNPADNMIYQSADKKIYAEHGNRYSPMCNRDEHIENSLKPLPLGYFVSRIVADVCQNELNETGLSSSVELADSGNPVFGTVVQNLDEIKKRLNDPDLGEFAHAFLSIMTAFDQDKNLFDSFFVMPNPPSPLSGNDVVPNYNWMKTATMLNPFTQEGIDFLTVDMGNSLDNQGSMLCRNYNHPIVVLGHTHVPKLFYPFDNPKTIYVNSGFMCPDLPGLKDKSKQITFVEVETTKNLTTVSVLEVDYLTGEIKKLMSKPLQA